MSKSLIEKFQKWLESKPNSFYHAGSLSFMLNELVHIRENDILGMEKISLEELDDIYAEASESYALKDVD